MKLILALLLSCLSWAQSPGDFTRNTSINPCPCGGSGQIDTISVLSLDRLVLMSNLIVVGTVVSALPAFFLDPQHLNVETDSQLSVTETLWGKAPSGMILLFELGGKVGPCPMAVFPDDPLVKTGEQFILFLVSDNRQVPNSSGIPRYQAIGWSGKAQIVDGKIRFLPRARALGEQYDNMDLTTFLGRVKYFIKTLTEVKLLH